MHGRLRGQAEALGGLLNKANARGSGMRLGKRMMTNIIVAGNNTGEQTMKPTDIVNINGGYNEMLSTDDPMASIQQNLRRLRHDARLSRKYLPKK